MSKQAELLARYLRANEELESRGQFESTEVDEDHIREIEWLLERLVDVAWARIRDRQNPGYADEGAVIEPDDEVVTQEAVFRVTRRGYSGTIFEGVALKALHDYRIARSRFGFDDPQGCVGMDFTTKSGVRVEASYDEPPRFESPYPEYSEEDLPIVEAELLECAVGTPKKAKTA